MQQNYKNHRRLHPVHHFVTGSLLLLTMVGAVRNLVQSFDDEHRLYNAALILAITVILLLIWLYSRAFALKAQDRVILLEEKLRHQQLAGRPLDSRLRPSQVIALRFAGDDEFVALCKKASTENLSSNQIKQSIRNWRGDYHRV